MPGRRTVAVARAMRLASLAQRRVGTPAGDLLLTAGPDPPVPGHGRLAVVMTARMRVMTALA